MTVPPDGDDNKYKYISINRSIKWVTCIPTLLYRVCHHPISVDVRSTSPIEHVGEPEMSIRPGSVARLALLGNILILLTGS